MARSISKEILYAMMADIIKDNLKRG